VTGTGGLPQGKEKVRAVRSMFDAIAPRYDLLNRVLTFGMDMGWRRLTVASLALPPSSLVLDVACGTGDLCRLLADAGYRAVGIDNSAGMLANAHTDVPLLLADALAIPLKTAAADGLTCGFALRNVTDLGLLFEEIARVVRPGGRIALLEVAEPDSKILKLGHHAYFHRVVPLVGGLLSDRKAYRYLPESTAYLPPPSTLTEMLWERGFTDVGRRLLGMGAAQLIAATRA
jgi:demethylmenaquinone methyltransferase/2-methoxy-6-polyprenyl-1,4-benzoquinol methylase